MAQLLSNLPIGSKVKYGKYSVNGEPAQDITWLIVAKNHNSTPAYPTNSITLLTEKIVDLRAFDAQEPNSTTSHNVTNGNNRYSVSNIDQWLNSDAQAGEWYSPRHTYDQSPTSAYVIKGTEYANRPGFLNAFSIAEKNNILSTNINVAIVDPRGYEEISRKVFFASAVEVGSNISNVENEGAKWEYFTQNATYGRLTNQVFTNTLSTTKPTFEGDAWAWWLRTPSDVTGRPRMTHGGGNTELNASPAYTGDGGVRPAMNLSASLKVSDTTDGNGYYTFLLNSAPPKPSALNTPTAIYGGKSNSISWSAVSDPDGDTVTYSLECAVNGGAFSQIYRGAALSYAHLIPFGTSTVSYRVKAIDTSEESSEYVTSAALTVVNNNAPVISGSDINLGVKSDDFTGTYTIDDANNNDVTVTEAIDGVQIRSLVVKPGEEITYGVTENTWLALANGSHTLTISATDGIDTTVRTIVFTKLADKFSIRNSTPWVSSTMPSRIMVVVTRNVPSAARFKVEVCNNGYDASPTWEDATDAVLSGLVHVFSNKAKTAADWGVVVRVSVERNGATGACYVSAIGGNFE